MKEIIFILGIIAIIVLIAEGIFFGVQKIKSTFSKTHSMKIYGDVKTSLKEGVMFYIIDNVDQYEEYWNTDLDGFRIYASGREISSRAFKSNDIPHGIRIALVGLMNTTLDAMHVLGATKFDIWEISFDGGATRIPINQVVEKRQLSDAKKQSINNGYDSPLHGINDMRGDKKKSEKSTISPGSLPTHGLLAHINEGKTTGTTMRYQIVIPQEHPILNMIGDAAYKAQFFHIFEGKAYKLDSKFVEHTGSLYEYDLINLKPGKIYVGLSTSVDGGETVLPSSALYGITKDKRGNLPLLDDAELAKPEPGAKPYKMWGEHVLQTYVGEQYARRMYDVIVKKHYEDEFADKYISLSRSQDFYDDYEWLKGEASPDGQDIHIARKIARVQDEHGTSEKTVKHDDKY